MIPESGAFLLWMSLGFALLQASPAPIRINAASAITGFLCNAFAFLILIYCFAVSDFSVKLVYENSHEIKPLVYKISGAWGNHEGSMLLLIVIQSFYSAVFSFSRSPATRFMGGITALLLAYTAFFSNPFERIFPVPESGMGLNPLLQDIGLALHPPCLYLGYMGFSVPFALALSALVQGKADKKWARSSRNWALFSWSALSLGITLGSWWAYRELGWGGFWFWDPVENASLMPWLAGGALLHSLAASEKREAFKKWSLLLAIITFSLSLVGFFLVRSGVLTSVHAFASDPTRGAVMLLILGFVLPGSLLLYGFRAHLLESAGDSGLISRETAMLLNNLLLSVLCATIFLGTIYPLALEAMGFPKISVGAPYYSDTFIPIASVLLALAGIGSFTKWRQDSFRRLFRKAAFPAILAVPAVFFHIYAGALVFLAAAMLQELYARRGALSAAGADFYSMALGHLAIAVTAAGILGAAAFGEKLETQVKKSDTLKFAGYEITFKGMDMGAEENFLFRRGIFHVFKSNREIGTLYPETRFYPVEKSKTTESALYSEWFSDLYIVIGDKGEDDSWAVRVFYKPFINLIWLGGGLMFLCALKITAPALKRLSRYGNKRKA